MAHIPEAHAQFEFQKMQLIGSLGAVAETMRNCATIAEQFAQLIGPIPYHPALTLPNGPIPHMQPPPPLDTPGGKRKRNGEEKTRRKAKPRDPNAPKRPPSSYLLFQNEVRSEIKAKNPNIPNNELLNLIAKAWSEMPKEQKDAYEHRQKAAKDTYLADKAAYETLLKGESEEAAVLASVETPVAVEVQKVGSEPVPSSTDDSSEDEQPSGSESTSDDDDHTEEQVVRPVAKKAKPPPPAPAKKDTKKEKKPRKTKA
ncbi:HMG-box [Trametopsis cervina]|nr:HMG-box [Trametopsis cervina]